MEIAYDVEKFEFCAVSAAKVSEKGMTLYGLPAVFTIRNNGKTNTQEIYDIIGPQKGFVEKTPISLTEDEVRYAIEHQQFARIGIDKLAPRPPRTGKKKKRK